MEMNHTNGSKCTGADTGHLQRISERCGLSDKQFAVARMIAMGRSTKEIAVMLNTSPKTTEKHRQQVYARLKISGAVELAHFMLARGWVKNMHEVGEGIAA